MSHDLVERHRGNFVTDESPRERVRDHTHFITQCPSETRGGTVGTLGLLKYAV